jgi:uncharacterized protein YggU (UPF0235/DUF167 family)
MPEPCRDASPALELCWSKQNVMTPRHDAGRIAQPRRRSVRRRGCTAPPWRQTLDGVVLTCRLTPKGGRDAIDGVATLSDGVRVLLARVRSAPEEGRANEALCRLIAEKLEVAASRVRLAAGAKSRVKQVAVTGEPAELLARCELIVRP